MIINQGFVPKKPASSRLPPGQYETRDFPILSLGPTPQVPTGNWQLSTSGLCKATTWSWDEFNVLPQTEIKADIHCVTKWSKFDTTWKGVSFDDIIKLTQVAPTTTHLLAHSHDGYSTNIPLADLVNGQALVGLSFDHQPIPAVHGGPARIVVPHLYFWKSAKWVKELEFLDHDQPGFWETRGYHNVGDPWKEERYS